MGSHHLFQICNISVFCACCFHVLFSSTNVAYKNEIKLPVMLVGENRLCLIFVGGRYRE